jgi:hypothetical protein
LPKAAKTEPAPRKPNAYPTAVTTSGAANIAPQPAAESFARSGQYLIVWADRCQVIHHRRRGDGEGIEIRVVTAGGIRLDPPGLGITVEEVYAG